MQIKLLTLASVALMVAFASASPTSNSDAGLVRRAPDASPSPSPPPPPSGGGKSDMPPSPPGGDKPDMSPPPPGGQVDPKLEDKLKQEKPEAQQFLAEFLDTLKQSGKMLDKKEDQDKLKSCASQ